MRCRHCDKEISEDMRFCPYCGQEQKEGFSSSREGSGQVAGEEARARGQEENRKAEPEKTDSSPFSKEDSYSGTRDKNFLDLIWQASGSVNSYLRPLQKWLYGQGSRGKWIIFGLMLVLGLIPYMGLSFFSSRFLYFGLFLTLLGIGLEYIMTKIPIDYAFKKAMIEPRLEAKRINILLLMLFGHILSLFHSGSIIDLKASMGHGMPSSYSSFSLGNLLLSVITLLLITFLVLSLFHEELVGVEDMGLFGKGYILMRVLMAIIITVIGIIVMFAMAGMIYNTFRQMNWF